MDISRRGPVRWLFIDLCLQIHNVHHPISVNLYYEDQKAEALRAAEQFRASRLPKFLQHFQSVLETNPANKDGKGNGFRIAVVLEIVVNVVDTGKGPFLLSNLITAADLVFFNNIAGAQYAFPRRLKKLQESGPHFPPFVAPSLTDTIDQQANTISSSKPTSTSGTNPRSQSF